MAAGRAHCTVALRWLPRTPNLKITKCNYLNIVDLKFGVWALPVAVASLVVFAADIKTVD
jgi:hypothetical protein